MLSNPWTQMVVFYLAPALLVVAVAIAARAVSRAQTKKLDKMLNEGGGVTS
jgi:hypothetical protein